MSRIEDLEKRLAKDPQSKIFAQLAEEYRKAGLLEDAINTCREGLRIHPNYFSARVALGRALLEASSHEEAATEFEKVLGMVPDNILANKFLAETYHHLGRFEEAFAKYQVAGMLAPEDTEITERLAQVKDDMDASRQPAQPPPPPPMIDDANAFDESDFESPEVGEESPAPVQSQAETAPPPPGPVPPPASPESAPPTASPEIEIVQAPPEEAIFELEDAGGAPIQTAEKPPSTTLAGQMSSKPLSDEARAYQDEFEQGIPTGVMARQSREIQDASPTAPPVEPVPEEVSPPSPSPGQPPAPESQPQAPAAAEQPATPQAQIPKAPTPAPAVPSPTPGDRPAPEVPPGTLADLEPQPGLTSVTLAELYASQGHLDQALAVYRELLPSRPNDPKIVQRIEELEMLVRASAEVSAPPTSISPVVAGADVEEIEKTIRILEGWLTALQRS